MVMKKVQRQTQRIKILKKFIDMFKRKLYNMFYFSINKNEYPIGIIKV